MSKFKIAIIGAGIAGLSAAFFAKRKFGDGVDLEILEKSDRPGGTIGVTRENGFIIDWGPNGFLDKEPLTLEFVRQLGITDKLYPSDRKSEKRFIYRNRKLWEINPNPKKFMTSGLLSLPGRLRIVMELLVPPRKDNSEESIYNFAKRRIGSEAAEILIDPMVSGIYGGDARTLELGSCFPVMEQMEIKYGGLIKAMIKKKKVSPGKSGGPAGPSGHLTSFRGGLYTLIERLQSLLKDNLKLSAEVHSVERISDGKYKIKYNGNSTMCDILILAVPSFAAAKLLKPADSELGLLLEKIPYSSLAVICQGYKIEKIARPLDGFGFLIPHNQKKNILGSIWTSVIFPEQAPEGYVLFRTMLGGAKNEEMADMPEDKLSRLAHDELKEILGIDGNPDYEKVIIWKKAIPQYILGHRAGMAGIISLLEKTGNIYIAGNAYSGIGLNDTIKRSYSIIQAINVS